jgi:hypothetical protein
MNAFFDGRFSRRDMLKTSACGFGFLALADLCAQAAAADSTHPLAIKSPHFPARAKRVIFLYMQGAPSHVDTFDYKPRLQKDDGKTVDNSKGGRKLLKSPFQFSRSGQSGLWFPSIFPHLATRADDLCLLNGMYTDVAVHPQATTMLHTGSFRFVRPSMGAWVLYGLGTENQSLPGFVTMCPAGLPTAQGSNWRSAFLPGIYQGTYIDSQETSPDKLVANIHNELLVPRQQRRQLDYIQQLNELHRHQREDDAQLDARIASLELAFRMQREAGDAFDIHREPESVRALYGDNVQGRQMLIARRLVERGVRYVQLWHGAGQPWDSHAKLEESHRRLAKECDTALAALLTDLKRRGLLDETLIIWGGEMGRTPTMQLPVTAKVGRDHHHQGFTVWLAGGGVRGGYAHGKTTELGLDVAEDPVHVHDLHATILHLLGFDHEKLTFRYAGRDFRLTDVHGRVVKELLA